MRRAMSGRGLKKRGGFTLIEMLVVTAIILVIASLMIPYLRRAKGKALRTVAQTDLAAIETAFSSYFEEYRRWPMGLVGVDVETAEQGVPGVEVLSPLVRLLGGENLNGLNPKQVPFMRGQKLDSAGAFVDPWGHPYKFMLDYNRDNRLEFSYSGAPLSLNRWIAVWSRGPISDETVAGAEDDIRSW